MVSALSASSMAGMCGGIKCWDTVTANGHKERVEALSESPIGLKGVMIWRQVRKQRVLQCASSDRPTIMTSSSLPTTPLTPTSPPASTNKKGVTIEFQRQKAKELVAYFEEKKYEEKTKEGRIFGWTRKNEINNGRWTMFGFAVGLLTEYATGVSLVDQIKIIISNLGIADI